MTRRTAMNCTRVGATTTCTLLLWSAVASSACSRSKRSPPAPTPSVAIAAAASAGPLGPRAELVTSSDSSAVSAPGPDAAAGLPVVDGPTLLQKIRSSGHKGVVVNAWASWCDPCREELPMLARVAPQLAALGVPIWLVSVDDPDGFPAAKAVLDSLHVELRSFGAAPPLQDFKPALNPNWPGMIPVSFLFDATGKLRYFWAGEVYENELVPLVKDFVAGKHIDGVSHFGHAPGATQGSAHE